MTVFGLTIGEALSIAFALIALVGGYVRLQMISTQNTRTASDALRVARETRDELKAVQLKFAQEYASIGHLKDVEGRLIGSIDKLTDRIDALITSISK